MSPPQDSTTGGIHVGDVGGNVTFRALGDIVGGNKIVNLNTTIQISVDAVTQRPLVPTTPYRGLERFEERDRDLFFGRDQLIKSLLAQLGRSPLLLVLGASGSGKSSVIRAGLLPALARVLGASFRAFTLVPDVNPFESLRSSLQRDFGQTETAALAGAAPDALPGLLQGLQRAGESWVIFIDQFEELFTRSEERQRKSFLAALFALAQQPAGTIKLVLAMRADFLDRFGAFPEWAGLIEKNIALVADLHADELRLAIEQPAAQHGVVFETGLVEAIIKDVQGQAGSLPLLQYTLDLLWQEERRSDGLADRHLNTRSYRELGGVRGALQKRADDLYTGFADQPGARQASPRQESVRHIFLRLVDIASGGAEDAVWRPVRRRVPMTQFTVAPEPEILRTLIDQKLLVSNREGDEATVEVAHEALFTSWGRLRHWIEGGKHVIFVRNRLVDDARRWHARRQADAPGAAEELLGGSRLAQALDLQARGDFAALAGGLGEIESQFLAASQAQRDQRQQQERERQARELHQAQALADEQKRRADEQALAARRQRRLTWGMVAVSLAVVAAAGYAVRQRNAAEAAANEAVTQRNAAEKAQRAAAANERVAISRLGLSNWRIAQQAQGPGFADPEISPIKATHYLLAAATSLETAGETSAVRHTLLAAQITRRALERTFVHGPLDFGGGGSFARDGSTLLIWNDLEGARVWEVKGPIIARIPQALPLWGAVFSADGRQVLTWSGNRESEMPGTAQVWHAADGSPVSAPLVHPRTIRGAAFSPRGDHVATWSNDGTARLWTLPAGQPAGTLPHSREERGSEVTTEPVAGAVFDSTGEQLVTWTRTLEPNFYGTLALWDTATATRLTRVNAAGTVQAVGIDARDQQRLFCLFEAQRDEAGQLHVWKLPRGKITAPRPLPAGMRGAVFTPDGGHVLLWGRRGYFQLWPTAPGEKDSPDPVIFDLAPTEKIHRATFSPDGDRVLAWIDTDENGQKGEARVWDRTSGRVLPGAMRHEDIIVDATFSPDGRRVLTTSRDGSARLWPAPARPPPPPKDEEGDTPRAFFAADGARVLTRDADGVFRFVDPAAGASAPISATKAIFEWSVSPDGQRLAAQTPESRIQLWDVHTGKPVGAPLRDDATLSGTAFNADGRFALTWSDDQSFQLWHARTGEPAAPPTPVDGVIRRAALSPDARTVVAWDTHYPQTRLHLHAVGQAKASHAIDLKRLVDQVLFSPDGRVFAVWDTVASPGVIELWNPTTGERVSPPLSLRGTLRGATFSADSRFLVVWTEHGQVVVAGGRDGMPRGSPLHHPGPVTRVTFSRDAEYLLAVGPQIGARLWDTAQTQCLAIFRPEKPAADAGFDARETAVLVTDLQGNVTRWDISVDPSVPIVEHRLDFEIQSATALGIDGEVRVLTLSEHLAREQLLAGFRKDRAAPRAP